MFMKNILITLLLFCSISLFGQSFDETKLNTQQKTELTLLTEDCQLTKVVYTDEFGNKFPVYYDVKQRTTFYVCLRKKHVKTIDLERRIAFVD